MRCIGGPRCKALVARPLTQMSIVAILGAGTLGGALAHKLARRDRLRAVRLIDPASDVATGKALDIQQAGPVERFETRVTAGEFESVVGAAAVVITGPVDTPENDWQGEAALALLDRVAGLTGRTPIVCAGASQGPLVAAGVRQLGLDRRRILRLSSGGSGLGSASAYRPRGRCLAGRGRDQPARYTSATPGRHMEQRHDSRLPARRNPLTTPTDAPAASCRTSVATRPFRSGIGRRPGCGSTGGRRDAADVHLLCR